VQGTNDLALLIDPASSEAASGVRTAGCKSPPFFLKPYHPQLFSANLYPKDMSFLRLRNLTSRNVFDRMPLGRRGHGGGLEDWRIGVVIKLDIVNKQPGSRNAKALQTTNIFGDWVKWRNLGEMRKGALIRE
jgi:hypothetical protein